MAWSRSFGTRYLYLLLELLCSTCNTFLFIPFINSNPRCYSFSPLPVDVVMILIYSSRIHVFILEQIKFIRQNFQQLVQLLSSVSIF